MLPGADFRSGVDSFAGRLRDAWQITRRPLGSTRQWIHPRSIQ